MSNNRIVFTASGSGLLTQLDTAVQLFTSKEESLDNSCTAGQSPVHGNYLGLQPSLLDNTRCTASLFAQPVQLQSMGLAWTPSATRHDLEKTACTASLIAQAVQPKTTGKAARRAVTSLSVKTKPCTGSSTHPMHVKDNGCADQESDEDAGQTGPESAAECPDMLPAYQYTPASDFDDLCLNFFDNGPKKGKGQSQYVINVQCKRGSTGYVRERFRIAFLKERRSFKRSIPANTFGTNAGALYARFFEEYVDLVNAPLPEGEEYVIRPVLGHIKDANNHVVPTGMAVMWQKAGKPPVVYFVFGAMEEVIKIDKAAKGSATCKNLVGIGYSPTVTAAKQAAFNNKNKGKRS
ncbi:hypothetical protein [Teichococcus vastitatis]|uniref:Uncharacterized protein n=1 Tax=Teichococcus vastitatis TaxID=2307076 RepID=A0ABS9WBR4_9PROT|nr:hypothetical protein [Pseudoroseomonas vastitatis]MCI0756671.1 hypothetical protein [Pseudoroseomonas vastitatis]